MRTNEERPLRKRAPSTLERRDGLQILPYAGVDQFLFRSPLDHPTQPGDLFVDVRPRPAHSGHFVPRGAQPPRAEVHHRRPVEESL